MTGTSQPLDRRFPIVDEQGNPTDYFTRWAQQRQIDIEGSATPEDVQASIDEVTALLIERTALTVWFIMNSGVAGVNAGPELLAPRSGSLTKCKVITKVSDPAVNFTFLIKKNGVNIFSANPTVAAGTAGGTLSTFLTLTPNPVPVLPDDIFTIDVTSGTATWQATVVLE